jgi:hypothetical protein
MLKITELITRLNNLKVRAEFIADHLFLLANEEFRIFTEDLPEEEKEKDFGKWGILKLIFKGSERLSRLLHNIEAVFDMIEEDIAEIIAKQKSRGDVDIDLSIIEVPEEDIEEYFLEGEV